MRKEELDELLDELKEICEGLKLVYVGLFLPPHSKKDYVAVELTTANQHAKLLKAFERSEFCDILFWGAIPYIHPERREGRILIAWPVT